MVFSGFGQAGWVTEGMGGGSVGQVVGRSVRRWRSLGPVLSQSWPSLGPVLAQPLKRKAWSDIASSVWELSLVWRSLV